MDADSRHRHQLPSVPPGRRARTCGNGGSGLQWPQGIGVYLNLTTRMVGSKVSAFATAVALCAIGGLALAPTAFGDPARPGVAGADVAVYGQAGAGGQTLEETGSQTPGETGERTPTSRKQEGSRGSVEGTTSSPGEAAQVTRATGQGGQLPFTGYLAASVLALGVAFLIGAAVLRTLSRDRAPSTAR
jgi:hypothetical protein